MLEVFEEVLNKKKYGGYKKDITLSVESSSRDVTKMSQRGNTSEISTHR